MIERNHFKEKLYHHTMPVNEGLWSAIEAQLPPEGRKKRFPVFWMTLFGTTLLGGALMIGVFTQQSDSTPPPTPPVKNEIMASALTEDNLSDDNDATGTTSLNTESNTNASTGMTTSVAGSANEATTEATLSDQANQTSQSNPATPTTPTTQTNNPTDNIHSIINTNQQTSQSEDLDNIAANTIEEEVPVLIDQESDEDNLVRAFRNTTMTAYLPMADMNTSATTSLSLMPGIAPDPNCYKFGDIGAHWAMSVDVMAAPGYSPKTYEENGGETADYITARKDTEKNQYAWSMGARLNLHHRNGLTARLGLNYTQVGDIFDYTDSLATQSTTRIDSFFAADGTFLYTEVTQVLIDGTLVKKIHNTYRYLDIPLLVGYEMRLGRNIIMLNAGPIFNLTHTYQGQILDSMLHPRSITPGEPGAIEIYKTNLGVSLYLGTGILFPLSDRFSALVEPSYVHRFKPVTLNSYELKENRNFFSLNLGVRYHIN